MYTFGRETLKNITLKRENLKAIAIRRESINVMVVRREKLKTIFATRENVSKVSKCTLNANHKSSNQFSVIKYIFYGTAGFLGYKLYKDNSILKTVEAAVPVKKSLSGRRNQFNFIADVVEQSAPSVVYIEIKDMRRLDFFTGRPATASNGSGFIIKEDGLIVTNAHVVVNKPNSKVEVRLQDGATYTGIVEDVDLNSDLALVRIQCKNLPVMKLGKSDDMRPGEFVVAIGSPLSLSNTVTAGVISSVHRGSEELGLRGKEMVYIQTDAAITFGNSGGPLVNLDGEAVGVNSMKVTAGISFAIPIDYVKSFLAQSKGAAKPTSLTPSRRYMGITMLSLTPQILKELQERQHPIPTDVTFGILVWKVIIGSPAHSGGLQPGDIVTHINGNAVKHVNDIYTILGETKNRVLKMTVVRLGQRMEVAVTPEDTM